MKDLFRRNLGLKLLSLLIAISLEIYFMSPQNLVVETFSAEVEMAGLPEGYAIVWPPAAEQGLLVACKVRGPGPLIQEVRNTPRKFRVKFPQNPPKILTVSLNASELGLPSGVELLEIQPEKFEFRIERILERTLPVKPTLIGEVPVGYRLESFRVEPETVAVSGPENEVGAIEHLETEEIDLGQFRQNAVLDIFVRELGGKTVLRRRSVRVVLQIEPILFEREFSAVKVSVRAPDGFAASVTPSRVKAVFSGDEASVSRLVESDLEVVASIADFGAGRKSVERVPLTAKNLPPGVRLLKTDPAQVEVTLVKRNRP